MYNKIFTKILDSSIWLEPTPTRLIWLTFIAAMDEDGFAPFASVPNLAHRARVPLEEAEAAVASLEGPDANSSDPENEGRRIERVPGGWMILNAPKYRDLVTRTVIKEQTRMRVARHRQSKKPPCNAPVTPSNESVTQSDTDTDTTSSTDSKKKIERSRAPSGPHQQFIDDWMKYYEKRNGAKYPFGGRDGKAVATLLSHFQTPEDAKRFIGEVHKRSGEGYPFSNADTLYELANNIAKLQAAISQSKNGHAAKPVAPLPSSSERYGEH